ncbi:MAG: DUF1152 domain-containing protein [Acidimicrobiales bacterium]
MLLVAAGGGGDAITASALAPTLQLDTAPPVLTYSWDRLLVDPLPGPRSYADFDGLSQLAPNIFEILPTTVARPPAGSTLPRLAGDLPSRILLLDPTEGAIGMAEQVKSAAAHFGAPRLGVVDVGGDIIAQGDEPNLRSPLADMLALAACTLAELPCQLIVLGPGIDGELDETMVRERLADLDAHPIGSLDADTFADVLGVFAWHPSEASGLLAAAANGARGCVETRDGGHRVYLTDDTTEAYSVDAHKAAAPSPAALLRSSTSLAEAADIVTRATGVDEIKYETDKAVRLRSRSARQASHDDLATVDGYAAEAAARGADYVTVRRLAELIGLTTSEGLSSFQALLADQRPSSYEPPLYRTWASHLRSKI